jgi:hypothetical protein
MGGREAELGSARAARGRRGRGRRGRGRRGRLARRRVRRPVRAPARGRAVPAARARSGVERQQAGSKIDRKQEETHAPGRKAAPALRHLHRPRGARRAAAARLSYHGVHLQGRAAAPRTLSVALLQTVRAHGARAPGDGLPDRAGRVTRGAASACGFWTRGTRTRCLERNYKARNQRRWAPVKRSWGRKSGRGCLLASGRHMGPRPPAAIASAAAVSSSAAARPPPAEGTRSRARSATARPRRGSRVTRYENCDREELRRQPSAGPAFYVLRGGCAAAGRARRARTTLAASFGRRPWRPPSGGGGSSTVVGAQAVKEGERKVLRGRKPRSRRDPGGVDRHGLLQQLKRADSSRELPAAVPEEERQLARGVTERKAQLGPAHSQRATPNSARRAARRPAASGRAQKAAAAVPNASGARGRAAPPRRGRRRPGARRRRSPPRRKARSSASAGLAAAPREAGSGKVTRGSPGGPAPPGSHGPCA